MGHGCRAALVLELIDGNRCKFKESEKRGFYCPNGCTRKKLNFFKKFFLFFN